MASINDIKKILEAAVHAPSGENCQPWRFEIRGDEIGVFNLPKKDQSLYNEGQMASYVAHGALIENILIANRKVYPSVQGTSSQQHEIYLSTAQS